MGIPSFVKFLKTNIPTLYTSLKKMKRQCNNIYIDMNYIINKAIQTHPYKGQAPTKQETKVIIGEIENILIECINLYKPKNLLYLALDGTLPRAKLNHFRQVAQLNELDQIIDIQNKQKVLKEWENSKKQVTDEIKEFVDQKQTVPFLQPGSEFLHEISEHIRSEFLVKKINEEWSDLKVIFSDDKVPTEFEQKVFDYIRVQTTATNYPAKDTHFIISNDADSISYALPLSDAYIFVSQNAQDAENIIQIYEIQKFLIDYYLGKYEDKEKKDSLLNEHKGRERIFHDFVLIFFFLGNEFLPSLPNLENKLRSMYHLLDCYKKFLFHMDKLNPIVTEDFHISLPRLQEYIYVVSSNEYTFLCDERKKMHLSQSQEFTKIKQSLDSKNTQDERQTLTPLENFKLDLEILEFENPKKEYTPASESFLSKSDNYLNLYYAEKFQKKEEEITEKFIQDICQSYLEGIIWTFEYFTRGCLSWNWYFQYKYVPFPTSLRDSFASFDFPIFEKGAQYKPMFQQLFTYSKLSVKSVLPESVYQVIEKELSHLYPSELQLENQGKYYFKQSIVKNLPQVDDNEIKQALANAEKSFTPEEKTRNTISKNPRFLTTIDCGSEKIFEETNYAKLGIVGVFQVVAKEGKVNQFKFKNNAPTPTALMAAIQKSEEQQQKEEAIIRKQKDKKLQAKQELQSKQPCNYKNNCFKLQHGNCPYFHTEEEIANKDQPKQKLCTKGDECSHHKKGTCKYYHP